MPFVGTATSAAIGWLKHAAAAGSTLLNSLVSYWTLDEVSGTRADSVGANDLTDNNTVGVSLAGPSGTVASFAEANAESLSTSGVAEPLTTAATWSFWVKESALAGYKAPITKWTYSTDGGWALQDINGGVTDTHWNFFIADAANDPGNNYFAVGPLANLKGSWHLHTFVYDGGLAAGDRMKFYLDGVEVAGAITGTLPTSIRADSAPYRIGDWSGSIAGREWDGLMGRVGIWSRAFDASDVAGIFNSGVGKSYADLTAAEKVDLVSYWNLDEVSGTRVDAHGANDLTDNNTVGSVNSGPSGTVASFVNANNESLSVTTPAPLKKDATRTISLWYFADTTTGGVMSVSNDPQGGTPLFLVQNNSGTELRVYKGGYICQTAVTASAWHHVIYSDNAGTVSLTVDNGTPVTSATADAAVDDSTFYLGSGYPGTLQGRISNVGLWSRVLDASERTSLFNSGVGKKYADLTAAEKVDLVSYWDLSETSGTRADAHGANDLTDNNTVGSVVNAGGAMDGGAASFVAANSEYLSGTAVDVRTGSFTVAGWYNATTDDQALIGQWAAGNQFLVGVGVSGAGKLDFYTFDGGYKVASVDQTMNQWNHFIAWFDEDAQKIYLSLNGGAAAETATSGPQDAGTLDTLQLGVHANSNRPFTGKLDEPAIWSRVLTADERAELYALGAGKFYPFS